MNILDLGKAIKNKRVAKNITQRELAKMLGYGSPQYISNMERGLSLPPRKNLMLIAKILGYPKKDLFDFYLKHETTRLQILFYGSKK